MKITTWKHENVREDGAIISKNDGRVNGAVHTEPNVSTSRLIVVFTLGRDSATQTVSGLTINFDSYEEMENWPNILTILNDLKF
jgi:hypothetical protein